MAHLSDLTGNKYYILYKSSYLENTTYYIALLIIFINQMNRFNFSSIAIAIYNCCTIGHVDNMEVQLIGHITKYFYSINCQYHSCVLEYVKKLVVSDMHHYALVQINQQTGEIGQWGKSD